MCCLSRISKNEQTNASTPLLPENSKCQRIKRVVIRCLFPRVFSNASLRNVAAVIVSEVVLGIGGYKIGSAISSENSTSYCVVGSNWWEPPTDPCTFEVSGESVAGTFIGMGVAACLGMVHYFCCLPCTDYEEDVVNKSSNEFKKEVVL